MKRLILILAALQAAPAALGLENLFVAAGLTVGVPLAHWVFRKRPPKPAPSGYAHLVWPTSYNLPESYPTATINETKET